MAAGSASAAAVVVAVAAVATPTSLGGAGTAQRLPAPTQAAASAPAIDPVGLGPAVPVRVIIDRIDVDVPVVPVAMQGGELAAPPSAEVAGWYERGISPGEPGSAVIIGYLTGPGSGAPAFANLDRLAPGDRIDVAREDGAIASFTVERVDPFSAADRYRGLDADSRLRLVGTGAAAPPGPQLVVFANLGP